MLDGIEALIALEKFGTVSEAATRLRLTQSAVSKRIQALQNAIGFPLIEKDGRRVRLTADAVSFLERARPVVADLRGLATPLHSGSNSFFSIGLADSIASSWGPGVVSRILRTLPDVRVALHAHRSVLVIESVRLGRYHIGLSTDYPAAKDLIHYPVIDEPLVLVNCGFGTISQEDAPLISIESNSATWRSIEPLLTTHHPQLLRRPLVPVESFGATMQMVKAGFGDGIVPLGMVMDMDLKRRAYRELPAVTRRVSLLTRKTVNQLESFGRFRDELMKETARHFSHLVATRSEG
jgi:DNA-binding transcriptional LysR family regulator